MNAPEQIPQTLAVTLAVTEEVRSQLGAGNDALVLAQSFEIDCAEMAQAAADQRATFSKQITHFEGMRKKLIEPSMSIIETARGWFNPMINGLTDAKKLLGDKLLVWEKQEQDRIREANRQREELARKLRQEAEQKAAQERARAEEQAREARRKAAEAEEARRKAEAEGNTRAAAAAAAAAAKAHEQATAAIENGEAAAQAAQLHAAAVATMPAQTAAKVTGFGSRENWVAELDKGMTEHDVIRKIAAVLATRPELIGLLDLNLSAANKLAKALKSAFSVPGLIAKDDRIAAGTRK